MIRRLILLLPFLLILSACTPKVSGPVQTHPDGGSAESRPVLVAGEEPEVRILLVRSVSALKIRSSKSVDIISPKGRRLARLKGKKTYHLFQDPKDPGNMKIFEGAHEGRNLKAVGGTIPLDKDTWIVPRSASFELNGKRYRGRLRLIPQNDHFTCVNHLPMEEYLRGVVPHEIGRLGRSGYQALKVQAVASRTYAVQRLRASRKDEWDMVDSIADQVYRGAGSWDLADRAIRETRGELVSLGREPAEIYYSSTCGGHTADIHRAWRHEEARHMSGVRDADRQGKSWCRSSKYFRWTHSWSAKELGAILRAYLPSAANLPKGTRLGRLKDLRILKYSSDGRVQVLEAVTDRGRFKVIGDRVRSALKRDMKGVALRSTLFRLSKQYDAQGLLTRVTAVGAGWGHGIGLCQVGAIERSKAGHDYRDILKAYFPGSSIRRFWS